MAVKEFNTKYCSLCGSQMCLGDPDEISHCGRYQGDIDGIPKLYFPEEEAKWVEERHKELENDPEWKRLCNELNKLLNKNKSSKKEKNTMQKCKIFEARDEMTLEKEYNDWADKQPTLVEVTHMNTFMKDGWYKMVLLYK